jgi:hypothetical protein
MIKNTSKQGVCWCVREHLILANLAKLAMFLETAQMQFKSQNVCFVVVVLFQIDQKSRKKTILLRAFFLGLLKGCTQLWTVASGKKASVYKLKRGQMLDLRGILIFNIANMPTNADISCFGGCFE